MIGASNRFAHAAALSVAEAPARSYNPLFIYGAAGLGKTHLLHAIGHHVKAVFRNKRVQYVSHRDLHERVRRRDPGEDDACLQTALSRPRRPPDRRHPVPRADPGAPGGVLPYVQPITQRRRADRHLLGSPTQVHRHPRGPAPQPLRVGTDHRCPGSRVRDASRHPPQEVRVRAPRRHSRRGVRIHRQQHPRQRPRARRRLAQGERPTGR